MGVPYVALARRQCSTSSEGPRNDVFRDRAFGAQTDLTSETWLGVGHRVAAEDAVPRALEAADDPSESNADAAATSHFLTDLFGALANGNGAAARHRDRPQVPVDPQLVA